MSVFKHNTINLIKVYLCCSNLAALNERTVLSALNTSCTTFLALEYVFNSFMVSIANNYQLYIYLRSM